MAIRLINIKLRPPGYIHHGRGFYDLFVIISPLPSLSIEYVREWIEMYVHTYPPAKDTTARSCVERNESSNNLVAAESSWGIDTPNSHKAPNNNNNNNIRDTK